VKGAATDRRCPRLTWKHWLIVAAVAALAAYSGWRFTRDEAQMFRDDVLQFKYGSTGGEKNFGIPLPIWEVLPILFKDLLPAEKQDQGWAAFGFIIDERDYAAEKEEKPRHRRPVGTSVRNHMGMDRIFLNCGGCHVGAIRANEKSERIVIAGMPSNTVDLEAFQNFLTSVAADPRFNHDEILKAIDANNIELDFINRMALRFYAIGAMKDLVGGISKRFEFTKYEPAFGPGRFDTFSPAKALLNWPHELVPESERIGVVDFPSVWMQKPKRSMWLHWDGNNNKVEERNRSAAFGTGATFPTIDRKSLKRFADFLDTEEPPTFESIFGAGSIDKSKAERGKSLYLINCARCHGVSGRDFSGRFVGQVTDIQYIGTDRHRLDNYTRDLLINQGALYNGNANERFQHFRKTNGYANAPLDGVWLRAPYLHNGSVPTLWDLLQPPEKRPVAFYRGYDVYDTEKLGFVSSPTELSSGIQKGLLCYAVNGAGEAACGENKPDNRGTCDAAACKGNGNAGHAYGVWLSDAERYAIIEYLKTF
jgi:mono/diheme cytochrome c family protein